MSSGAGNIDTQSKIFRESSKRDAGQVFTKTTAIILVATAALIMIGIGILAIHSHGGFQVTGDWIKGTALPAMNNLTPLTGTLYIVLPVLALVSAGLVVYSCIPCRKTPQKLKPSVESPQLPLPGSESSSTHSSPTPGSPSPQPTPPPQSSSSSPTTPPSTHSTPPSSPLQRQPSPVASPPPPVDDLPEAAPLSSLFEGEKELPSLQTTKTEMAKQKLKTGLQSLRNFGRKKS